MLKRLNLVLVCVLFISIHNANASTPGDLYKSLASAIATARYTASEFPCGSLAIKHRWSYGPVEH